MNEVFGYKKISVVIFLFLTIIGCKKDANNVVPNVYVDIYLSHSDPAFSPINAPGGWIYLSGGVKGIVVYRKSQTEFMAYDRECTYKVSEGNQVAVDNSNLIAVDSKCGSKFLLTDGSVNTGPASVPLKHYQTADDGTQLHIFN